MQLLFSASVLLGVLALYSGHTQAAEEKKPCTAHSSKTTSFYDLRPLSLHLPVEDDEIPVKGAKTESWKSSGYDYGTNFSINICAPVLEEVHDVVGLKDDEWRNVSAYYAMDGKTYSMG
jgi:cation-dependent mannose-6-phosphate receptor